MAKRAKSEERSERTEVTESKYSYGGRRFGDLLIEAGVIDSDGLRRALAHQRESGERLGESLVTLNLASEPDIVGALASQLEIEIFDRNLSGTIDSEVVLAIPEHMARHHHAIAVARDGDVLTVAIADPLDLVAIDDIRVATGCELKLQVGLRNEIDQAIGVAYRNATASQRIDEVIAGARVELGVAKDASLEEMSEQELRSKAEDAPIVKLVNIILAQAIAERATDIHIEPLEDKVVVRYRVDGVLFDSTVAPQHFHEAIVVRIKILSDMDVAERRIPLDGRFTATFEGREIDVRVSTLPTIYGEKVALRLLDKSGFRVSLEDLGFES